jgi:colanic acid/amylovoran biosynthesis glycosyltransferase
VFFGEGTLKASIERQAQNLLRPGTFQFFAQVSVDELTHYLQANRPTVLVPSTETENGETEGMPVVAIMAMAAGCPLVASQIGAMKMEVTEDTGYPIPQRSVDLLAERLKTVFQGELVDQKTSLAYLFAKSKYSGSECAWLLLEAINC